MKRKAYDYLGNEVGEIELPDNTPEEVWEEELSDYAKAPEPEVILDVNPSQFRQALILSGISIISIEAAINSQPEPVKSIAMTKWEYSLTFKRNDPLVNQIAQGLGFTDEALDNLWKLAGTL